MYHELLFHLDLCILAYHQYTQTLIWPFDPYYEQLAEKGTSRRDNFMAEVRSLFDGHHDYHGPGGIQGWATNPDLDPIIADYRELHPWRVAFCRPEESWLLYNVPTAITQPIAAVHMASYQQGTGDPNKGLATVQLTQVATRPGGGGTDQLYCFEGGTGSVHDRPNHWSLMGCVLERETATGYDVHIAFRGSRSGSGARALSHGIVNSGNPDWVTDMDFMFCVEDAALSSHGAVCRGFSRSVKTCIPAVLHILQAIHAARGGPPESIYVTGHSLGGALATQFASAMNVGATYGQFGANLPGGLPTWPWRHLRLISFSAPVAGDKSFHRNFNAKVYARRVVLSEDPITTEKKGYHVGAEVYITGENMVMPLSYHEPMNVRERLYRKVEQWGDDLDGVVAPTKVHEQFPWKVYDSFTEMYAEQRSLQTPANLRAMLGGLKTALPRYLGAFATMMGQSSAYVASRASTRQAGQLALANVGQRIGASVVFGRAQQFEALTQLATRVGEVVEQFGDVGKSIGFALMLAELVANPDLDFVDLKQAPVLKACLQ